MNGYYLRTVVACLVAGAFVLLLGRAAAASPTVDQQQLVVDTSAGFEIAIGGPSQQKLAQVVTPGVTGALTEVRLPASCGTTLTVTIQAVAAGKPNGTVLGTQTAPFTYSPSTTFHPIVFSSPVPVTAGVPYAIVLTTSGQCGIWPGPVGDPYPRGNGFFDSRPNPPGVWASLSIGTGRFDLPFQTLVDPADVSAPAASCSPVKPGGAANAGFFRLAASDDVGIASIVIEDSRSAFVSAGFASGDVVKVTEAPGTVPTESRPGPERTAAHLRLRGDAVLRVTDTSGNTARVTCQVPPPKR